MDKTPKSPLKENSQTCVQIAQNICKLIVAQCSVTPASVAATPPAARHFFRGSLTCDTPGSWRATGATGPFRGGGCSVIPLLHRKNLRILRKSAAARVARQGVPAHVCNYALRLWVASDAFLATEARISISRVSWLIGIGMVCLFCSTTTPLASVASLQAGSGRLAGNCIPVLAGPCRTRWQQECWEKTCHKGARPEPARWSLIGPQNCSVNFPERPLG